MRQSFLRTGGAATLVALALCATPPAAQARGLGVGGAVALGILGGVVAGSAIASASNGPYPGRPVYAAPDPYGACHVERRAYIDPYGYEHVRQVEVCE
ncbi:MAG: complement resistance protein TraT [Methylobacterium organophilum]|nr:complement resistance protein TraT [Methylobacterium organophilum]